MPAELRVNYTKHLRRSLRKGCYEGEFYPFKTENCFITIYGFMYSRFQTPCSYKIVKEVRAPRLSLSQENWIPIFRTVYDHCWTDWTLFKIKSLSL